MIPLASASQPALTLPLPLSGALCAVPFGVPSVRYGDHTSVHVPWNASHHGTCCVCRSCWHRRKWRYSGSSSCASEHNTGGLTRPSASRCSLKSPGSRVGSQVQQLSLGKWCTPNVPWTLVLLPKMHYLVCSVRPVEGWVVCSRWPYECLAHRDQARVLRRHSFVVILSRVCVRYHCLTP